MMMLTNATNNEPVWIAPWNVVTIHPGRTHPDDAWESSAAPHTRNVRRCAVVVMVDGSQLEVTAEPKVVAQWVAREMRSVHQTPDYRE